MSTIRTVASRIEGRTLIIEPQQTVSSLASDDFHAEFNELLSQVRAPEVQAVIVDFSQMDYFGSMILEALRRLAARVRETGGRMALCGVSDVSREILHITHFDTLWPIFDSCEEALASLWPDSPSRV